MIALQFSDNETCELSHESDVNLTETKLKRLQPRSNLEVNSIYDASSLKNSPKHSLFVDLPSVESNSNLSDARSEYFIKNKQKCKKTISSNKSISVDTNIDSIQDVIENISRRIEEISGKLDVSIANQMKLMAHLLPHEREMIRTHNLPALPLKSVNEFWKFEKYLKDPGNMSAMIKYISCYGNNPDETKATMNIMKKLIYNCLAKNMNFKGIDPNSTKIPLEQNHMWNLVQGAVIYNREEKCNISKIKKACQNWLKQAPNRKQETVTSKSDSL